MSAFSKIIGFSLLFSLFLTKTAGAICTNVTPSFSVNQSSWCGAGPHTITFSNTSTGINSGTAYYIWAQNLVPFDTLLGLGVPINQSITAVGSYDFNLIAIDSIALCRDTFTLTVTIHNVPTADFNFVPDNDCIGTDINFTDASTGLSAGVTYQWDFDDGTADNVANPTHAFSAAGTYDVALTVTNFPGCTDLIQKTVTVVDLPIADFSGDDGDGDTHNCLPPNSGITSEIVNFTNNSTGASSYFWDFGDGATSTAANPSHTYNAYGVYTVTLSAITSGTCQHDTTLTVTFGKNTQADFTIPAAEMSGCVPHTVNPVNNSLNGTMFIWDFGDATPPDTLYTPGAPAHVFKIDGAFTVSLTVINGICDTTIDYVNPVIVGPPPHPAFGTSLNGNPGCSSNPVTFTNASIGVSPPGNMVWDFGNGNTHTGASPPPQTYDTAGTYVIWLTAYNGCTSDTISDSVVIYTPPVVEVTADDIGCSPFVVAITNNTGGGGLSYVWRVNGVITSLEDTLTDQTFTAPAGNTLANHSIELQVSNMCGTADTTIAIEVHPEVTAIISPLNISICAGDSVVFTENSEGDNLYYSWDFDNGNTSNTSGTQTEFYHASGTYNVEFIVDGYCGDDSLWATITVDPRPTADYTQSVDTICALGAVNFTNASTGASSYQWSFGDANTSSGTDPAHSYTSWGVFNVELIAISGPGCRDTSNSIIVVDSVPITAFTAPTICLGDSLHFIDNSAGNVITWTWDFGDGKPLDNKQHPVHYFDTAGTFDVALTRKSTNGCQSTINQNVIVNAYPVAGYLHTIVCDGQSTVFTDTSKNNPEAWAWDFGDGASSAQISPSHLYTAPGNYTAKLVVNIAACKDSITQNIQVDSVPVASFNHTTVCIGDTKYFTSNSGGSPDIYQWNFDDGSTDLTNDPTPEHIYTTAGFYDVELIVAYTGSGCADTMVLPVQIGSRTLPGFRFIPSCSGLPTQFIDTTKNSPIAWEWDFGEGGAESIQQSPTYNYGGNGKFLVTLITENSFGCKDTLQDSIHVYGNPTANFARDTACSGAPTTFTDLSVMASTWLWDFDDGTLSAVQSPQHHFPGEGSYHVRLVVSTGSGCTDTLFRQVDVSPNPKAKFFADTACYSYSTTFVDSSFSAVSWEWDFNDGSTIDNDTSPQHVFTSDGIFDVRLVVSNTYGCYDTLIKPVLILEKPQSGFISNAVCAGDTIFFTDTTTGSVNSWEWDLSGVSVNVQNTARVYPVGGTYPISLITNNAAGCSDTLQTSVEVGTTPVPYFTADTVCFGDVSNFTDLSTDSFLLTDYFWDFGDGNNSTSQNPNYIYQAEGEYDVSLTVTNEKGCDSSFTKKVRVTEIPIADFTYDTICGLGAATTFTDTSSGFPSVWLWDFGDGTPIDSAQHPNHVYSAAGSYLVSLTVSGGKGCFDQQFKVVKVYDDLIARMEVSDTLCIATGLNFIDSTIINTTAKIANWDWDFGDGDSSAVQHPQHTYDTLGIYDVVLTVTSDDGCVSAANKTIIVSGLPVAEFVTETLCENQLSTFIDSSTSAYSKIVKWDWDFGDASAGDSVKNPKHQYHSDGAYYVRLVVEDKIGCKDTMVYPVIVWAQPSASFTSNVACYHDTFKLKDRSVSTNGNLIGWEWDFHDGDSSTQQNATHVFNQLKDSFEVSLVVTTQYGCTDTISKSLFSHPLVDIKFSPDTLIGCAALQVSFNDSSSIPSGTIINWRWSFDDGEQSYKQHPSHVFTDSGTFYPSVIITSSQGCKFYDTLGVPITVFPQPEADFNYSPKWISVLQGIVDFTDASKGGALWEYDFGDGFTDTDPDPQHEYVMAGTYTAQQIVMNDYGCADTVEQIIVVRPAFTFFVPNAFTPNGDQINDEFKGEGIGIESYMMSIYDRWGRKVFETDHIDVGWDGTLKDGQKKAVSEVYAWKVVLVDVIGEEHEYMGHLSLIR